MVVRYVQDPHVADDEAGMTTADPALNAVLLREDVDALTARSWVLS